MANRRNRVVGLALIAPLAACATYAEPAPDTPHAELILASNLGADPFHDAGEQQRTSFSAWADAACAQAHGLLASFEGRDGSQQTLRIPAGRPFYIRTDWTLVTSQSQTRCANLVSFLPEAGEVYEISQTVARSPAVIHGVSCFAIVRSMDTDRQTKSMREHPIEGKCK